MQELQIKPDYHAQIIANYNEIMQMIKELKEQKSEVEE